MIRGIPKEGWKHVGEGVWVGHGVNVMIRGIPKEGWKPDLLLGPLDRIVQRVMIRGIPKEGWKRLSLLFPNSRGHCVMIRGIPKEGWKRVKVGAGVGVKVGAGDDQRNP
jgi:hypothetical protein